MDGLSEGLTLIETLNDGESDGLSLGLALILSDADGDRDGDSDALIEPLSLALGEGGTFVVVIVGNCSLGKVLSLIHLSLSPPGWESITILLQGGELNCVAGGRVVDY